jgi:hypothetical protein
LLLRTDERGPFVLVESSKALRRNRLAIIGMVELADLTRIQQNLQAITDVENAFTKGTRARRQGIRS